MKPLGIDAAIDQFELGKAYYLDFTPVDVPADVAE